MSEIKSWDTVFFIKETGQNIGIRVYYIVDHKQGTVEFQGDTNEFGTLRTSYNNNPYKGDVTTVSYEFRVVVSKSYSTDSDKGKIIKKCIDIKVDAFQKTEIKTNFATTTNITFVNDDQEHKTTECIECTK